MSDIRTGIIDPVNIVLSIITRIWVYIFCWCSFYSCMKVLLNSRFSGTCTLKEHSRFGLLTSDIRLPFLTPDS